jgi:intracellular sulfur oxidation DsrE/DsrF family protein
MKTFINLILAIVFSMATFAQDKPVKIVFDVTSDNVKVHGTTVRHVKAMSQAYPDSQFEVVMYSGAMDMVLKDKSSVESEMEELAKNENVSFVICEGTMKRHKVDTSQLIPGVTTVPDGILEIIKRQSEGWGYIKEAQ